MKDCKFHSCVCTSDEVFAVEQKNFEGQTIGVVFVCDGCLDKVTGNEIQISIGDPIIDEGEVMN